MSPQTGKGFFPNGIAKVQQNFNAANFSSKIFQKLLPLPLLRTQNRSCGTCAMNIDILSKMVKDLILDNDKVSLPGLGSFVAESVPASFSDDGYAIRPPYRKLYFRRNVGEDGLLAGAYSKAFGVSSGNAEAQLREFIQEMKAVLDRQKVIIFPSLGKLRATQENNYFFVTDDDIDICPEYNRLETLPLKVRKEPGTVIGRYSFAESQQESPVAIQPEPQPQPATQPEQQAEPQPDPQPEPQPQSELQPEPSSQSNPTPEQQAELQPEPQPELKPEPQPEPQPELHQEPAPQPSPEKKGLGKGAKAAIWTCAAVAAAFAAFVLVSRLMPGSTDFLLYNEDEIEILRAAGL